MIPWSPARPELWQPVRRMILVPSGVLLAFAGSSLALVLGLLGKVMSVPAEASLGIAWIAAALQAGTAGTLGVGLSAVWTALVASCLVPVSLVATVGEALQLRSLLWLAGGTGILTAAMPRLLRTLTQLPSGDAGPDRDGEFTVLLLITGIVAGSIYWLVAGARTGESR